MLWLKWTCLKLVCVWEVTRLGIMKEKQTTGSIKGMKIKRWGCRSSIKVPVTLFGGLSLPFVRYQHTTLALQHLSNFLQPACQMGNGPGWVDHRGGKKTGETQRVKVFKITNLYHRFFCCHLKIWPPGCWRSSHSNFMTMYLKLHFYTCVFTHFQALECSWREVVPAPQVANVSLGKEGEKQSSKPSSAISRCSFLVLCRCWNTSWVLFLPPYKLQLHVLRL